MSNYERSTRECHFEQLQPGLQQAFREYFNTHALTNIDEASLVCCETVSHKKETGWLAAWLGEGQEATIYTAIVLGAEALFWARCGEQSMEAVRVISANLYGIRVKKFTPLLTRDNGLEISGLIDGSKGFMRGYIGLGTEPAAQKFCDDVAQAIEKINPKPVSKFPSWMGGR